MKISKTDALTLEESCKKVPLQTRKGRAGKNLEENSSGGGGVLFG